MAKFLQLIKRQFKSEFNFYRGSFERTGRLAMVVLLVCYILVVAIMAILFRLIVIAFNKSNMATELMTIALLIVQVLVFFGGVTRISHTQSMGAGRFLLDRAPLESDAVFLSRFLLNVAYMFVIAWAILIPMFLVFGFTLDYGYQYYLRCLLLLLLVPIPPIAISTLMSVPLHLIRDLLKKVTILRAIMVLAALIFGLMLYINFLSSFKEMLIAGKVTLIIQDSTMTRFVSLTLYLPFVRMMSNIALGANVLTSTIMNVAANILILVFSLVVSRYIYPKVQLSDDKKYKSIRLIKRKSRKSSVLISLIKKEFIIVIGSTNYTLQYLGMMICVPIFVYFTMSFLNEVSAELYRMDISAGMSIFVLVMYSQLSNIYSTSSISREGKSISRCKVLPVSFQKQILAKTLVSASAPFISVLVSCVLLMSAGMVRWYIGLPLMLATLILVAGRVCQAILSDLKKPLFRSDSDSYDAINWSLMTTIIGGVGIAAVIGVISIVLNYYFGAVMVFGAYVAMALIVALPSILRLYRNCSKYYARIYWR